VKAYEGEKKPARTGNLVLFDAVRPCRESGIDKVAPLSKGGEGGLIFLNVTDVKLFLP